MTFADKTEKLTQNLIDAGCSQTEIRSFLTLIKGGHIKQALDLLAVHRQALLDEFHRSKSCIDCLDYLVFQLEKEQAKEERK